MYFLTDVLDSGSDLMGASAYEGLLNGNWPNRIEVNLASVRSVQSRRA
jgi:hypothetical protein